MRCPNYGKTSLKRQIPWIVSDDMQQLLSFKLYHWFYRMKSYILIYTAALVTVLYVTGYEMKLIRTELLVNVIKQSGINYDAFRDIKITEKVISLSDQRITHIIRKYPELNNERYIDPIGYLTFSMLAEEYNPVDNELVEEIAFVRGIGKVAGTQGFQELYGYYTAVLSDLRYFPVPRIESESADVSYGNTWFEQRKYGGNRRHEGTDLLASNNIRGFFPVVSITDGLVENMGWLKQGGYRIGIRSECGGYFYYAHLYSYAPQLKAGDKVIAGQLLGFMGDSGYGSEGTIGQFDVHLHVGIYVRTVIGDMSINPYWILEMLEQHRTQYQKD